MNSIIRCNNYDILLTSRVESEVSDYISRLQNGGNNELFILTDENTHKYCLPVFANDEIKFRGSIIIPEGERSKSLSICEFIYDELINAGADRNSILINIGGGVISDIGGFVASTYKRGIKHINIPTSLLAMVDASAGGKTGIDFRSYKNIIGTFCDPLKVFISPVFLKTLPDTEWKNGLSEMIKHALLSDENNWNQLKFICSKISNYNLTDDIKVQITNLIEDSVKYKSSIVNSDFKEQNVRKFLNFGHTIGHAVESVSLKNGSSEIRHGEAVAIGMICETYLSVKSSGFSNRKLNDIIALITAVFDKRKFDMDFMNDILIAIRNDKKISDGKVNFVQLTDIGSPVLLNRLSDDEILESIQFFNNL